MSEQNQFASTLRGGKKKKQSFDYKTNINAHLVNLYSYERKNGYTNRCTMDDIDILKLNPFVEQRKRISLIPEVQKVQRVSDVSSGCCERLTSLGAETCSKITDSFQKTVIRDESFRNLRTHNQEVFTSHIISSKIDTPITFGNKNTQELNEIANATSVEKILEVCFRKSNDSVNQFNQCESIFPEQKFPVCEKYASIRFDALPDYKKIRELRKKGSIDNYSYDLEEYTPDNAEITLKIKNKGIKQNNDIISIEDNMEYLPTIKGCSNKRAAERKIGIDERAVSPIYQKSQYGRNSIASKEDEKNGWEDFVSLVKEKDKILNNTTHTVKNKNIASIGIGDLISIKKKPSQCKQQEEKKIDTDEDTENSNISPAEFCANKYFYDKRTNKAVPKNNHTGKFNEIYQNGIMSYPEDVFNSKMDCSIYMNYRAHGLGLANTDMDSSASKKINEKSIKDINEEKCNYQKLPIVPGKPYLVNCATFLTQ